MVSVWLCICMHVHAGMCARTDSSELLWCKQQLHHKIAAVTSRLWRPEARLQIQEHHSNEDASMCWGHADFIDANADHATALPPVTLWAMTSREAFGLLHYAASRMSHLFDSGWILYRAVGREQNADSDMLGSRSAFNSGLQDSEATEQLHHAIESCHGACWNLRLLPCWYGCRIASTHEPASLDNTVQTRNWISRYVACFTQIRCCSCYCSTSSICKQPWPHDICAELGCIAEECQLTCPVVVMLWCCNGFEGQRQHYVCKSIKEWSHFNKLECAEDMLISMIPMLITQQL